MKVTIPYIRREILAESKLMTLPKTNMAPKNDGFQ